MEVAPFTITLNKSFTKYLFLISTTLGSGGLDISLPKRAKVPLGDVTIIPFSLRLRLSPGLLEFLKPLQQQSNKRFTLLFGVIDPNNQ